MRVAEAAERHQLHAEHLRNLCDVSLATSATRAGSPLPHLRRDWARPRPHLHRDWARPCHICAGTGLALAHICTGTALALAHICTGTALALAHICTGTALALAHICTGTALGLAHICTGTALALAHICTGTALAHHATRRRTCSGLPRHERVMTKRACRRCSVSIETSSTNARAIPASNAARRHAVATRL
jgi:hypothetical protein